MLNSVEINAFQRIPYLKQSLAGFSVHLFCGPNESGKSTLGEAVRFAVRGLSPRVSKKGAYNELIHNGKKSGHVEIDMDGFPIRRNIRDGKVVTKATLDYPNLLVDIQLGAEEFGLADRNTLRAMLNDMFKVGAQDEFIRARLRDRGVTDDMMNRTLPLIRASGFDAAAEAAKAELTRSKGEWEGITSEKYGSVKSQGWKPEILSQAAVTVTDILDAKNSVRKVQDERDTLNRRLGAIAEAMKLHEDAPEADTETLMFNVDVAQEAYDSAQTALTAKQDEGTTTRQSLQDQCSKLEADILAAKQATATLECPCCGVFLHAKTKENALILVIADQAKTEGPSLLDLTNALTELKGSGTDQLKKIRTEVDVLRATCTQAQIQLNAAQTLLTTSQAAKAIPVSTEADAELVATQIAQLDQAIANGQSTVQDYEERAEARKRATEAVRRATIASDVAAQWAIITEAFGDGPNGIPAELVAATTKPINTALAKIALPWDAAPCVMGADLSLSRADGTPYYLLSASGKWKANAMMQLALATVSTLKLVVLDGWDVIQPSDRGAFIDMLTDYTQRHPDITIVGLATLKAMPVERIDGVRFYWIQDGQLKEAA